MTFKNTVLTLYLLAFTTTSFSSAPSKEEMQENCPSLTGIASYMIPIIGASKRNLVEAFGVKYSRTLGDLRYGYSFLKNNEVYKGTEIKKIEGKYTCTYKIPTKAFAFFPVKFIEIEKVVSHRSETTLCPLMGTDVFAKRFCQENKAQGFSFKGDKADLDLICKIVNTNDKNIIEKFKDEGFFEGGIKGDKKVISHFEHTCHYEWEGSKYSIELHGKKKD